MPQYGVDLARYREIHEVEMKWYFDLVDVLCPSIYPVYSVAVPAGQNQVEPSGNEAYILGMVGESVRVSRGKPVYPFFLLKYHPRRAASRTSSSTRSTCVRVWRSRVRSVPRAW